MSTYTTKLGDDFLRVPKLASDGKNYVIFKDRLILSLDARGISGHLDGTSKEPAQPSVVDSTKLTADEQSAVTAYEKEFREWKQSEAIVKQQIASTIPDSLFMKVRGERTAKGIWDLLKKDFEKRSRMFMVDLRRRLQDERCGEGNDVHTHFDTMRTMREDLAAIGGSISDEDFTAMILGSLPASYDAYLSAITATVSVTNTALDPEALMVSIIDEYDRRTVKSNKNKKDDKNAAFYAGNSSKRATEDQRKILNASIARSEGMSRLTAGLRVAEKRDKGLKEKAKINQQEMNQMLQMMRMESGWLPLKIRADLNI